MKHDAALLKAIRYFGTQQALGKAIQASQQRVNYWLASAKQIPYEYVLKIEAATKGHVTRYELAPNSDDINKIIDIIIQNAINKPSKSNITCNTTR